ncbi:hypothetical protein FRB96_007646 [Tulasnella sp. 330]|nr:hypothetical protein FRB96_007646 [Tulasnella sp. 330]KAG8889654.1 hypothetical protein FRB98_003457 [Tulasnella sp. 332]
MGQSISRKYTELIYTQTSKYPNWDPPKRIEVGDYGSLNDLTGEFQVAGNIYHDEDIAKIVPNLAKNYPPLKAKPEDLNVVCSDNGKYMDVSAGPELDVAGLASASFTGKWKFERRRGALLVMLHPRLTYLPRKGILGKLAAIESLKAPDMVLVTETLDVPAYAMYISARGGSDITLGLMGRIPVGHVPGVTAGAMIETGWSSTYASGTYRSACATDGEYNYTPLFVLEKLKSAKRGEPIPENGEEAWTAVTPPWGELDSDGEEVQEKDDD